jgi:hypothetical protein
MAIFAPNTTNAAPTNTNAASAQPPPASSPASALSPRTARLLGVTPAGDTLRSSPASSPSPLRATATTAASASPVSPRYRPPPYLFLF